jgi:hypothetical protein
LGQVGDASSRQDGLLGKNQAIQYGEYEGNNLFSDIELTSYFCSVF